MERRKFLKSAGAGIAAGAAMMPTLSRAQAAALPAVKWRLASSFPRSLDTIYGAAEVMAKRVAACTGGKFQIQVFAGGEIVPAFGVVDAVQNGTVAGGPHGAVLLLRQGPRVRPRHRDPLQPQRAPDQRLADLRRRQRALRRVLQGVQDPSRALRQHRRPDGWLVPQGDPQGLRT